MTYQAFTFESTDGTTVTTANSGALLIATGTGSTQTYRTAAAYQGNTGVEFVTTGNASALRYQFAGAATATKAAFSVRAKIPAVVPQIGTSFLQVNDTGGNRMLQITYTTSGNVTVYDKNNTAINILTAAQATAGTWIRVELVVSALGTSTGAFTARAYNTANVQVGVTASSSTANTGTLSMSGCFYGIVVAQTGTTMTVDLDTLQFNDGATSEIGPYVVNSTPPTITSISAFQTINAGGQTVNLTATATAANGDTIAHYNWSFVDCISSTGAAITPPTITGSTGASASFVMPSTKGRYRLQVTATDGSGNVSTASTTRVFYPDTSFTVLAVTSSTGWASSNVADIQDASDLTYNESGAPGSGGVLVLRLTPMVPATTGFDLDIRSLVQAASGSQKVALLEGSTVRKDWGAISPATSFTDQHLTLTTAEMATIGSWNELDLQLTQV